MREEDTRKKYPISSVTEYISSAIFYAFSCLIFVYGTRIDAL